MAGPPEKIIGKQSLVRPLMASQHSLSKPRESPFVAFFMASTQPSTLLISNTHLRRPINDIASDWWWQTKAVIIVKIKNIALICFRSISINLRENNNMVSFRSCCVEKWNNSFFWVNNNFVTLWSFLLSRRHTSHMKSTFVMYFTKIRTKLRFCVSFFPSFFF